MNKYFTKEFKCSVVENALTRTETETLSHIATHYGIGKSTLSRWMYEVKQGKLVTTLGTKNTEKRPVDWTLNEKRQAVSDSDGLPDQERGGYCREHGIYPHHLDQWKQDVMSQPKDDKLKQYKADNRALKEENKKLQCELRRKEKALAEAAALIILKKKAQTLFNLDEDS